MEEARQARRSEGQAKIVETRRGIVRRGLERSSFDPGRPLSRFDSASLLSLDTFHDPSHTAS